MKKLVSVLLIMAVILSFAACKSDKTTGESATDSSSSDESTVVDVSGAGEDGVYTGKGNGYGGELEAEVLFEGGEIKDITLGSNSESSPVITRAFPIIKERIISAQTPVVDSVSSATYSSFAVKAAVAQAAKEYGIDFGDITIATQGTQQAEASADVATDLVIIGAGPAGLSAAISAKENGVENIIIVEKLDILSGNGKFDMNFFDIVNTQAQKANNVEDSADKFYEDKLEKSMDSPERIRVWADGAADVDSWLRSFDVKLEHNWSGRSHMAAADQYAGEYIQNGLEAKVAELGIEVRTGTKGLDFVTAPDGAVLGITVENKAGTYDITADAVVLATGGFSVNKDLLAKYAPGAEIVGTSNSMGATGDFVPVFEERGYKMDSMDVLSVFKMINVPNRDLTGAGDGFILVNEKGERFVDESSSGLEYAHALLEQPNSKVFYIYDQRLYDSFYRLQKHNNLGYHNKADTLEELADKLGVPADALAASLEGYNAAITGDVADPFRETPFEEAFSMDGPFYGTQVEPAIHMTKGGVVANEKAQVLTNDDKVVPNLYAAGEVTATTAAYAGAVIWGREAGEQAALQISGQ